MCLVPSAEGLLPWCQLVGPVRSAISVGEVLAVWSLSDLLACSPALLPVLVRDSWASETRPARVATRWAASRQGAFPQRICWHLALLPVLAPLLAHSPCGKAPGQRWPNRLVSEGHTGWQARTAQLSCSLQPAAQAAGPVGSLNPAPLGQTLSASSGGKPGQSQGGHLPWTQCFSLAPRTCLQRRFSTSLWPPAMTRSWKRCKKFLLPPRLVAAVWTVC